MKTNNLADMFRALEKGNIVEGGRIFKAPLPEEKITWQVIEKVTLIPSNVVRITFRLYYLDVFLSQAVAEISQNEEIQWLGKLVA